MSNMSKYPPALTQSRYPILAEQESFAHSGKE